MNSARWKRIETLFHQALEKAPEERSAFLDAACGGDSELKSHVQTLLRGNEVDDGFLDAPAKVTPGTRLGQFEILSPLGKGGMGEVWRAKDTTLGREVAVKTLPEAFARDPERLARFEREAKLLAALNHPNIAVIHGLEEAEGTQFLVLELIEGPTLEERLEAGPIPTDSALEIALQIARALEAAHEKGVIHRDLKPGNIKVTAEGQVKVLDFGLAKAVSAGRREANVSSSPTLSLQATAQGVLLGTAAYMAPEQARGEAADERADIWAFGCVLFEMLAGQGAFDGPTVSDLLASVLKAEPDWTALPEALHPRIRFLLERCLEKQARDRCQGIGDARAEIQKALSSPETESPRPRPQAKPQKVALWAGAALLIVFLAGLVVWNLRPQESGPVTRFAFDVAEIVGPEAPALLDGIPREAVSPDGHSMAFAYARQIYLRNRDEEEAYPIPGAVGFTPTFSPDGEWLAYVQPMPNESTQTQQIRKIPVDGGTPQTLATLHLATLPEVGALALDWDARDMLTYVLNDGIWQVPASGGGEPEQIVRALEGEILASPQVLPGGNAILFSAAATTGTATWNSAQVVVQALGSSQERIPVRSGRDARYVSTGHLLYAEGTTLYGQRFDEDGFQVSGGPAVLLEGVPSGRSARYEVSSEGGDLVYVTGRRPNEALDSGSEPRRVLLWVDRSGDEELLPVQPDYYSSARVSPDGGQIALVVGLTSPVEDQNVPPDIYLYDLETQDRRRFISSPDGDDYPVWTSDSGSLYFRSLRGGEDDLPGVYRVSVNDGEEAVQLVAQLEGHPFAAPSSLSADDRTLFLSSSNFDPGSDILTLEISEYGEAGEFTHIVNERQAETAPMIAPNGQWLAYTAGEGIFGPKDILIRPFPEVTRVEYQIASLADSLSFSPDGSELYFRAGNVVSAVPITYEPRFDFQTPEPLFEGFFFGGPSWDVDPISGRFLMIRTVDSGTVADAADTAPPPVRIHVVLNWARELLERLPVE